MGTILQRLDAELATFTDSFAKLVKASRIDAVAVKKTQGSRVSGDLLEVLAEKLVLSGQLLISMIEELKRNAALNDFAVLNQNIARQDAVNETKAAELHAQLTSLQEQLLAQQAQAHSNENHPD